MGLLDLLSERYNSYGRTLLWLRRILTEISQHRHKFDPRLVQLTFMMHKAYWEMLFAHHFSFPCQYHSTNAPYSFIHLPPTLYNVFLPVLQFSLSVSFHQCSILIHSSTPTLYNVFLPVLQFPLSVSFHQCSIPIHPPTTSAV